MNPTDEEVMVIREIYRETIYFPDRQVIPERQFFLCPVGLVGAGKSTVIVPLTKEFELVRVSTDEVRKILKERNLSYDRMLDIYDPLVKEIARAGYSIAFDADCGSPTLKKVVEEIAQETGANTVWIHINPPESFIIHKLKTYNHTWLFKDGDEAIDNYLRQKKRREQEGISFHFLATVDTSRPDLPEQIAEVEELIRSALA